MLFLLYMGGTWVYGNSQATGRIGAAAMQDPSHVCNVHHNSWQHWIPDPQSEARDQSRILMDTSWIRFRCTTMGTPYHFNNKICVNLDIFSTFQFPFWAVFVCCIKYVKEISAFKYFEVDAHFFFCVFKKIVLFSSEILLNRYRSLVNVINLYDTVWFELFFCSCFLSDVAYVFQILKVKHCHFHNSYVLMLFFLKEVEECCVIRIPRHAIFMYLMGILEIEIVVCCVHRLYAS